MFLNCLGHRNLYAGWEALRERYNVTASQSAHIITLIHLHCPMMNPRMSVSDYISSLLDSTQELEGTPDGVTE